MSDMARVWPGIPGWPSFPPPWQSFPPPWAFPPDAYGPCWPRGQRGVTDGSDTRPGEVGEWVQFVANPAYTTSGTQVSVTLGILDAGDWDYWASATPTTAVNDMAMQLTPVPTGFTSDLWTAAGDISAVEMGVVLVSTTGRALTRVSSVVVMTMRANNEGTGPSAGGWVLTFNARRRR